MRSAWHTLRERGVRKSDAQALEWFRPGAEQGHAQCQCRLGQMYAVGVGVAQDDAAAREWLDKSAAQGFSVALFTLDVFYPDKINGPRVPAEIVPRVEQFRRELGEDGGFGVA